MTRDDHLVPSAAGPGPRLADSLEILAEILHPEEFAANHRGTAWEVFEG